MKAALCTFLLFCSLQVGFWYQTRHHLPDMSIVPEVPGKDAVKALSLGDGESFFRLLGLQIQSAGDTFGRFTALKLYDYNKLYHWFLLLDDLDNESDYIPSMATYYYSQTQNTPDVKYVVDYLVAHAQGREEKKWWWLIQAIYLAEHKLKDKDRALEIANKLVGVRNIPVWAQQMPAFVFEERGEMDAALKIIEDIQANVKDLSPEELNFMQYFVEERLHRLDALNAQRRSFPQGKK